MAMASARGSGPAHRGDLSVHKAYPVVDLSVIVPTFNEAENLPLLLPKILDTLESCDVEVEVIVVDDDSPDGTWQVAEQFAANDSRIRSVRRVSDRGLSPAVLAGMAVATGNVLAVIDGDLQHDESILPALLADVLAGSDISVGSREAEGGSYGEWSPVRRAISWCGKQLARKATGVSVSDPMSGFFAISRERYEAVRGDVNPRGFKILLEFLARGEKPTVTEVGYEFRNRVHGATKLSGSVLALYLIALFDLLFGRIISSTFTAYALVGASGVLVRVGIDAMASQAGVASAAAIAFVVSVLSNYVLNNRITFARYAFRGLDHIRGFMLFVCVSLYGLIVQVGVSTLAEQEFDWLSAAMATLVGIVLATSGNYLLNSTITWRAHRRAAL